MCIQLLAVNALPELWVDWKPPSAAGAPNAATPKPPKGDAGAAAAAEEEALGFPKLIPLPKGDTAAADPA